MSLTERFQAFPGWPPLSFSLLALIFFTFVLFQLVFFPLATHRDGGDTLVAKMNARPTQSNTAIIALVPGVFSLPVIQQPEDKTIYVANRSGLLTQFQLASLNGVTGLMAHNYLSGKDFYKLDIGQEVRVVYTDHRVRRYQVTSIRRFQKLRPRKLYSDFVDLETHEQLTTSQVFDQFYRGGPHVTFQTCLEGEGRLDWGILFVVASPLSD